MLSCIVTDLRHKTLYPHSKKKKILFVFNNTVHFLKEKKKSQETFNIKSIFDTHYFDHIYVIAWKNKDQLDLITNSWLSTENEDAITLSQKFFYTLKFSTTWNFLIIKVKMKLCTSSVTSPISLCWALISGCVLKDYGLCKYSYHLK